MKIEEVRKKTLEKLEKKRCMVLTEFIQFLEMMYLNYRIIIKGDFWIGKCC